MTDRSLFLSPGRPVVSAALGTLLFCTSLRATTIDPFTFEELVDRADLVGIVECTRAGGIVAHYRVIESWKGDHPDHDIAIRVAVNYWEPQFPIALVGDRYVVTAFRRRAPHRLLSASRGGGVPLWWRAQEAEYALPLFQGRAELPGANSETQASGPVFLGTRLFESLDTLRREALAFVRGSPAEQELRKLRGLLHKEVRDTLRDEDERFESIMDPTGLGEAARRRLPPLLRAADVSTAMEKACALATRSRPDADGTNDEDSDRDERLERLWEVLAEHGTEETLSALRSERSARWPGAARKRAEITRRIEERLEERRAKSSLRADDTNRRSNRRDATETESRRPTRAELARWRQFLESDDQEEIDAHLEDIFEHMPAHDPEPLARWLARRPPGDDGLGGTNYPMSVWFCWKCGNDRERMLRILFDARDPCMRVAAAIWTIFEDYEAGKEKLRQYAKLPGDPGVWAALNLARRGDLTALRRALDVLATPGESGMDGVPHRNLQKRLLVLLSNSAAASGVRPPQIPLSGGDDVGKEEFSRTVHRHFVRWFEVHRNKLRTSDPWLGDLIRQKMD